MREMLDEALCLWPDNFLLNKARALAALDDRDIELARTLAKRGLDCAENSVQARVLLARVHIVACEWEAGLARLFEVATLAGPSPEVSSLRIQLLVKAGRVQEADAEREFAFLRWSERPVFRREWAGVLIRRDRFDEGLDLLLDAVQAGGNALQESQAIAEAMIAGDLYEKVKRRLPTLRQCWGDVGGAPLLAVLLAEAKGIVAGLDTSILKDMSERELAIVRKFALMLIDSARPEVARALLESVLERNFRSSRLLPLLTVVRCGLDEEVTEPELLEAVLDPATFSGKELRIISRLLLHSDAVLLTRELYSRWIDLQSSVFVQADHKLRLASYLASKDEVGHAKKLVMELNEQPLGEQKSIKLRWLREALGVQMCMAGDGSGAGTNSPLPDEVLENGHISHFRYGEDLCILWFSGIGRTNLGFFQDSCWPVWRRLGVSVVVVDDSKQLGSLGGFGCHYPNRHSAGKWLKDFLSVRGYRRFATCGMSLSGYSALVYGYELGAAGALSFAGTTQIPSMEEFHLKAGRLSLQRLLRSIELDIRDARPLVQARPEMIVHCHYGTLSGDGFDAGQANRIADLPNVVCFPKEHNEHQVIQWLHANNLLETALRNFVEALS